MPALAPRGVKKILHQDILSDLAVSLNGKETLMLGPAGPERELSIVPAEKELSPRHLPVLLGSGLGHALDELLRRLGAEQGPYFHLAVVDKEKDILAASGLKEKYAGQPNILWVSAQNADDALKTLSKWQAENDGKIFLPVSNPFYLRLDRAYYGSLRTSLETSAKADFWGRADYAKFKGAPKILLLTSSYFLIGDLEAACLRMGLEHELLRVPDGELAASSFVEKLLEAVLRFKPDFALTINHLGVDREGILQDLLGKLRLPLASWFVDNPQLILYRYKDVVSPWSTVFTWDADNLESLAAMGFEHVAYLPLATDHARFAPLSQEDKARYAAHGWAGRVSFVGNSMLHKVTGRLKAAQPSKRLREAYPALAAAFSQSEERSVYAFMQKSCPGLLKDFEALGSAERQLSFETLVTWEATLRYRLSCVQAILPFKPLIAGDDGWLSLLPGEGKEWHRHQELSYYAELPYFYPFSEVNFNCTSKQMKGAVNQRVFDVPATESFVITDWREQMDNLFDPGKEVVCYREPEEATELVARYLHNPQERLKISRAARKRILAKHLYEHRLEAVIRMMRSIYA